MASGGGSGQQEGVNLARLNLEQLSMLRDQVEKDTERLSDHFQQLQAAVRRFAQAGRAVKSLAEKEEGTDTLVPLTGSLYVNGKLGSTDKVLIDIGTGYYLEKTTEGGVDYCERKVKMVEKQLTQLKEIVGQKQKQLHQIVSVMEMKVKQQRMGAAASE